MSVFGNYKSLFKEASHCLFEGNLDDMFFRSKAIQKIEKLTAKTITLSESGELPILTFRGKQGVAIIIKSPFGNYKTVGYAFKDENTEAIKETT